jgi:hypothetical protein
VFQHAISSVPTFSEGYCTGDNARAFILAVLIGELGDDAELERSLARTSAAFLHQRRCSVKSARASTKAW